MVGEPHTTDTHPHSLLGMGGWGVGMGGVSTVPEAIAEMDKMMMWELGDR